MKARKEDQGSVTVGEKSFDAMWTEFADKNSEPEIPPGALTAAQYAQKFGVSLDHARLLLARRARAGILECLLLRTNEDGKFRMRCFYLPKHVNHSGSKNRK